MAGGRPKTYDRDEEAELLREWAKKDDAINLLGFTVERGYPAENLSVWANENPEFSKAVKFAKQCIAVRREKMLNSGKLHNSTWQRCAALYDTQLHLHERAEKEFESNLRSKEEKEKMSMSDLLTATKEGKIKQE